MAYLAYLRGQGFFIVAAILLRRVKSCSQSAAMQVTHRDCGNTIGKEKERMKRERERRYLDPATWPEATGEGATVASNYLFNGPSSPLDGIGRWRDRWKKVDAGRSKLSSNLKFIRRRCGIIISLRSSWRRLKRFITIALPWPITIDDLS